jgi:lipoprotein-releasing system ATP-binding protein
MNKCVIERAPVIECRQLSKSFSEGKLNVDVLKAVNFQILPGEQIAIIGPSGAGKSTLLHLLSGLDKPSSGEVLINNKNIHNISETMRCQLRNQTLGFVYQFHHLLPEFTVLENVCIPLLIRNIAPDEATILAKDILEKVGLDQRLEHKIGELSGGERQRTAIARALVTKPLCVLADEPTGNLDQQTSDKVYHTMLELNRELATAFIIVTHDLQLTKRMDKVYKLQAGELMLV